MKRIKIVVAIALASLLAVGGIVALSVTMTGSGSVGAILPGWSVIEQCTPAKPGDSRGSVGSASFRAKANTDSRFVMDNEVLMEAVPGSFRGRVSEVSVGAQAEVSVVGPTQFLNVDKTMPPIWLNDANDFLAVKYGSGTGQVGQTYGIAVDPVDGGVLVSSYGTVDGVDRLRVIKFDAGGGYVTEFGSSGSGNGQFGGPVGIAVAADQSVWVGDGGNSRIQKFVTADGGLTYSYSAKVGANGSGNGQFGGTQVITVAVDSSGNVYATDRGNTRLQKFNSSAVYQAQVATSGSISAPYDVDVSGSDVWISYPSVQPTTTGNMVRYNSSLVLQQTLTLSSPIDSSNISSTAGVTSFAFDSDGYFWAHWVGATYLIKYDISGNEIARWQSLYPVPMDINVNLNMATGQAGVYALFRTNSTVSGQSNVYGANYVVGFDFSPVTLSAVIEQYMEACDSTLNGWTLDYQAASDPNVVFPGWSDNVWAKLKELFAIYNVDLGYNASTQTFIVYDIGSRTITLKNTTPVTTHPVNLTGGRPVDVVYQQPVAGGGVVWDAATENVTLSIGVGETDTAPLYTVNHPVELAQPVPTDTLPIQPGQYYVVDSTGAAVPAATWLAAGGNINLQVGESPGTISRTLIGPSAAISGFTGPFSFKTGNDPEDIPALSIVGNGTFTTPVTFIRSGSQGQPFNSPFMDTVDRVLSRGHAPSLRSPNVSVTLSVPSADLPGIGETAGCLFEYEDSIYRIIEVQWGNLNSTITAERHVTLADLDAVWAGQALSAFDAAWDGYSLGDIQVQPLRTA